MRRLGLSFLVVIMMGCNAAPVPNASPKEAPRILGEFGNARRVYGRLKAMDTGQELGDLMLAFCGCRCWRVLVVPDDGSPSTQILVHFQSEQGDLTSVVTVSGEEGENTVNGVVNQGAGVAGGTVRISSAEMSFLGNRSETLTDDADTCRRCHLVSDPVWPLPDDHPAFQTDPLNCLSCHSLG